MGKSVVKTLMGITLYEISEDFIYNLRQKHKNPENIFNFLPEYTINTNKEANNQPIKAEYFHQYLGHVLDPSHGNGEKYLYFNVETLDRNLLEEFSNAGVDELFDEFNFKKILSYFKSNTEDDLSKFVFPTTNYLIVEIIYGTSYDYYSGGFDCDVYYDIIGYLNNNLELTLFNDETIRSSK